MAYFSQAVFSQGPPIHLGANIIRITAALHTPTVDSSEEDHTVLAENNRNGWVNPEDLASMPQCIAQQDQSTWLSAMTKCTEKRCTNHFGVICTHHQWLTELSCLSTAFSPGIVEGYLPYCGRSILAKAQLYRWIRNITGRTWLVDVGDANGLENISPASLAEGYTTVDVINIAPTCLTGSVSAPSLEPFQRVMASCGFTGTTQHTGNEARPWEYHESLRSMIALDMETVGYDLVGRHISDGDYFDKECFCNTFTLDLTKEPCSGLGQLDLTKERLWINATCGSAPLPDKWTDELKTTQFAYIPMEDWHWPMCVADMPKEVTELTDHCATDACEPNPSGYCEVKRVVDRACFCHNISYNTCQGSCHVFESRVDYVQWLHDLCGNVEDWHGLPENWRQLAVPTPIEMIPWGWTVKPSIDPNISHTNNSTLPETCASSDSKLGSFALINIAPLLVVYLSHKMGIHRHARDIPWHSQPSWLFRGALIAALQLLANWLNALVVQKTPGYEDVPVIQLMLLWCSRPRVGWLTILLIVLLQPVRVRGAAASLLCSEIILQLLSSYYMFMTVNYGREHNFYFGGMDGADRRIPATKMYAGAFMWLLVVIITLVQATRATHKINRLTRPGNLTPPTGQRGTPTTSQAMEELMGPTVACCARLRDELAHRLFDESRDGERTPLTACEGGDYVVYGTFSRPTKLRFHWAFQKASIELYAITVMGISLLWIAQWLFWSGFIGLSLDEFCPPQLRALTTIWIAFSLAGVGLVIA